MSKYMEPHEFGDKVNKIINEIYNLSAEISDIRGGGACWSTLGEACQKLKEARDLAFRFEEGS